MAQRRNPYVHPAPEKGMLNQAGNDGWSFDEYDDEGKERPRIVLPGEDRLSHEDRAKLAESRFGDLLEQAEGGPEKGREDEEAPKP